MIKDAKLKIGENLSRFWQSKFMKTIIYFGGVLFRFVTNKLLFGATCCIYIWLIYDYFLVHTYNELSRTKFRQSTLTIAYELFLVLVPTVMSIWSLYGARYGNPGFVSDFFRSKLQEPTDDCADEGIKIYNVYHKEDFDTLEDDECASTLKPIAIAHLNDKQKVKRYSSQDFYRFKFCKQCNEIKPPRAHHCGMCNRCILRMDHHCPWIGGCVGLLNHKQFWLFMGYTIIALQMGYANLLSDTVEHELDDLDDIEFDMLLA
jgi:hypothetical protein